MKVVRVRRLGQTTFQPLMEYKLAGLSREVWYALKYFEVIELPLEIIQKYNFRDVTMIGEPYEKNDKNNKVTNRSSKKVKIDKS